VLARPAKLGSLLQRGAPTRRASVIFCARDFLALRASKEIIYSFTCPTHPCAENTFSPLIIAENQTRGNLSARYENCSLPNLKGDFLLKITVGVEFYSIITRKAFTVCSFETPIKGHIIYASLSSL